MTTPERTNGIRVDTQPVPNAEELSDATQERAEETFFDLISETRLIFSTGIKVPITWANRTWRAIGRDANNDMARASPSISHRHAVLLRGRR